MPEYAGFVHTAAGAGNNGLTINLYARNDHSGSVVATTSTDSNGYWAISHGTEGRFDIEVVIDSSNKYRIRYDDQYQIELGEFGQLFLRGTDNAFTQEFRSLPTASRVITFPDATATALLGGYANTSTGVMSLTSTANSAAAVYLHANGGTSETVKIYSNQGTSVTEGAESVNILSDAGGVGIRSTADLAKAVNVTVDGGTTGSIAIFNDQGTSVTEGAESISVLSDDGGIGIRSTANLANAVNITVDGGTTSTMTLFNDQGTSVTEGAASVQLLTDVGGIGIKSTADLANAILLTVDGGTSETITIHSDQGTAATEGAASIQLLSDVGGINIKSGLDAADAILLTADGGTSEKIRIHADQGTGVDSIELASDAGGIELNVASAGITGSAIKDEDGMDSNSAVHLATQQSIKAYVDASPVGDITNVIAGAGMTGGSTSGEATLNVIGGNGITANSGDVEVTPGQTTITSIYNSALLVGADDETAIDFGTSNEIDFKINDTVEATLDASALYPLADAGLDLGTSTLGFNDLHLGASGILNFDNANMKITHSTGALTVAGGTFATAALTATTFAPTDDVTLAADKSLNLPQGANVKFTDPIIDDSIDSHDAQGIIFTFTAGSNVTPFSPVYLGTDDEVHECDGDEIAKMPCIGVSTNHTDTKTNGQSIEVMVLGLIRDESFTDFGTNGAPLYVSAGSPGIMTNTAPSGTDDVVQVVGHSIGEKLIFVQPCLTTIEHA